MVLKDKRNHQVKFDVRRSLKPLIGRFDPFLTALTKRSQTLSNGTVFYAF